MVHFVRTENERFYSDPSAPSKSQLKPFPSLSDPATLTLTVVVPAKDEESSLPGCLASVCAQTYPNLEILVVDDRSTDGTAATARAFAASDPRVRVIAIDQLPRLRASAASLRF